MITYGRAPDTEVMNDGTIAYGFVADSYQISKDEIRAAPVTWAGVAVDSSPPAAHRHCQRRAALCRTLPRGGSRHGVEAELVERPG